MDASMNHAIRATIPLLTAPLADICNAGALDSLHVALMSTLSAHLLPAWEVTRPAFGAPLRMLHLAPSPNVIPLPLERAAQQIRIKAADWVALILAHNRTTVMSISIDPGMVAVQLAEQSVPRVYWQEDLAYATRSSSPVSPTSSMASSSSSSSASSGASLPEAAAAAAAAPWNARKSRLPSLVAGSQRQAQQSTPSKMLIGSPRTPKSFSGFSFPSASGAPQISLSNEAPFGGEEEPSWMTSLLSVFPDVPPKSQSTTPSPAANVYRPPHTRAVGAGVTRAPHQQHIRSESTDSWSTATSTSTPSTRSSPVQQRVYSQLALNMSQLSLASTTSTAPSLISNHSSSSSSSSGSQRAASPTEELAPSTFYDLDVPSATAAAASNGQVTYIEDGLPSPCSPTASAYAYVDHAARTSVTEYECGKVGVLGGAVMLGVPVGAKPKRLSQHGGMGHSRRGSATLPARGAMPSFVGRV